MILGNELMLQRVTPSRDVFLRPPDPLVLEVRTFGRYNFIQWVKDADPVGLGNFRVTRSSFVHFGEAYVRSSTSPADYGVYEVELNTLGGQQPVPEIDFAVVAQGTISLELYLIPI